MLLVYPQENEQQQQVEQTSFVRLEQKFLLPKSLWPQLKELLNTYSQASYLDNQTDFNLIESVYYDSDSLRIYNDHFSNKVSRLKVRTRRYAPNGVWKKSVFMEIKKKEDGIGYKERLKVPVEQIAMLSSGIALGLTEQLIKKNKRATVQELSSRVNLVNSIFEEMQLRPQARIVYHREAFEKDGFRVTVDDDLNYELLRDVDGQISQKVKESDFWFRAQQIKNSYTQGKVLILELKHNGQIPEWMMGFLAGANIQRAQFSKYCFAITNTIAGK